MIAREPFHDDLREKVLSAARDLYRHTGLGRISIRPRVHRETLPADILALLAAVRALMEYEREL